LVTASQAAAFENSAPISRGHALAESMHAHSAADLWLVRTFYHFSFLTLKIIAVFRILPFKTGTVLYRKGFDSVNSVMYHSFFLPFRSG
jgi:hypothetical protein